jgi:hypothetical protein
LDIFETSARILSAALEGVSRARIMTLHQHLRHDEIEWLLKTLVDRNLLELDSHSTYWTAVNGVKFLEVRFNLERILQLQKTLV